MKYNAISLLALSLTSAVSSNPLVTLPHRHPAPRATGSTAVNVPLTDWIKNGNTDLQWYTTISVGNPPQNL